MNYLHICKTMQTLYPRLLHAAWIAGDKYLSKLKQAKNSTTNPAKEGTEAYGSEDDEFDPAKAPSEDVDVSLEGDI